MRHELVTRGLPGQHGEPWFFFLFADTRSVAIPYTGHPLDGPVVHQAQAAWIQGRSRSMRAQASSSWTCGPRVFKRMVEALEAHRAEVLHVELAPTAEVEGRSVWRFDVYPPGSDEPTWAVTLPMGGQALLRWLTDQAPSLVHQAGHVWVSRDAADWARLSAAIA